MSDRRTFAEKAAPMKCAFCGSRTHSLAACTLHGAVSFRREMEALTYEPPLTERYYCGCVRSATWQRCEAHTTLAHDEEPPAASVPTEEPSEAAEIQRARDAIARLCNGGRWTMSVPARPDEDPDLIFADLVRFAADTAADLSRTRRALEALQEAAREIALTQYDLSGPYADVRSDDIRALRAALTAPDTDTRKDNG